MELVEWKRLSPVIREVLTSLKDGVSRFGEVAVSESKYWIRFKTGRGRAFASLHPSRSNVRVFISCDEGSIEDPLGWTKPSLSTGSWGRVHPLVFNIRGLENIEYAVRLLEQSYNHVKDRIAKAGIEDRGKRPPVIQPPSHGEIVDLICGLGEIFNFYVRREEQTPDGVYRCDVTWRDYEGHISPLKVFEVELSGNVDHALSSLAHAYDTWRPEQLYLVVEDERDSKRAEKLLEPRIRGAFARISRRLRIIGWSDLHAI